MRKGFTLVELVMVIVIIGILAVVAIPKFINLADQAKNGATQGALGALRSGIAIWYVNYAANNNGNTTWPAGSVLGSVMSDGNMPTNAVNTKNTTTANYSAGDTTYGWYYISASGAIYAANNSTW